MDTLERQTLIARRTNTQAHHHPADNDGSEGPGAETDRPDPAPAAPGKGAPGDDGRSSHETDLAFDPIAAALRQIHDHVAAEEIPEEFLRLLDQLDDSLSREPGK